MPPGCAGASRKRRPGGGRCRIWRSSHVRKSQAVERGHGMAWVRIDDGFVDHPKIAAVGAIGAWLQLQALCYANRNLTDGFIPYGVAEAFVSRGMKRLDDDRVWELGETSGMAGRD